MCQNRVEIILTEISLEQCKEAWFDDARCPPNTAEPWIINLSTPQNFLPRDCTD